MRKLFILFLVLLSINIRAVEVRAKNNSPLLKILMNYEMSLDASKGCEKESFDNEEQEVKYFANRTHIAAGALAEGKKEVPGKTDKELMERLDSMTSKVKKLVKDLISEKGCESEDVKNLLRLHSAHKKMPIFSEWKASQQEGN